jgi:hypothetical protein
MKQIAYACLVLIAGALTSCTRNNTDLENDRKGLVKLAATFSHGATGAFSTSSLSKQHIELQYSALTEVPLDTTDKAIAFSDYVKRCVSSNGYAIVYFESNGNIGTDTKQWTGELQSEWDKTYADHEYGNEFGNQWGPMTQMKVLFVACIAEKDDKRVFIHIQYLPKNTMMNISLIQIPK